MVWIFTACCIRFYPDVNQFAIIKNLPLSLSKKPLCGTLDKFSNFNILRQRFRLSFIGVIRLAKHGWLPVSFDVVFAEGKEQPVF